LTLVEICFNSAMAGLGDSTVNVSEAALPVPPLVDVMGLLVLVYVFAVGAVTLTVTVHDPPAATVDPLKLTLVPLAAAVQLPPRCRL
jgi:hypothetical protein